MCWNREEIKKKIEEVFPDFNFDEKTPTLTANIKIVKDKTDIEVNSQPLFTLTAEEVKIVKKLINKGMDKLGHEIKFNRTNPDFFKNAYVNNLFKKEPLFKEGEKIINRIKQYQNENTK